MPIYPYKCVVCHREVEVLTSISHDPPQCCGAVMGRRYTGTLQVKDRTYPHFVRRMDDIHKAQEQRGERLRVVHPWEVM